MRCPNPKFVWPRGKVIAVPCGKCLACLSNKRQDWSFRLMQEYKVSDSAHFVTLTYSEKFLPSCGVVKRHLQLYFKRLRKLCPKLRYYAVGEYGSLTKRPHYHGILFNCLESAVREVWSLRNGLSGKLEPIGIVHVGKVTEASVAYVLKYIVQSGERLDGCNDPFALMSRGHALGGNYLTDDMVAWHRAGGRVYAINHGEKVRLARFYKDKIWPNSSWSDWAYRRKVVNDNALMEAELREKKNNDELKRLGYSPDQVAAMRAVELGRVKVKVAFSQKF